MSDRPVRLFEDSPAVYEVPTEEAPQPTTKAVNLKSPVPSKVRVGLVERRLFAAMHAVAARLGDIEEACCPGAPLSPVLGEFIEAMDSWQNERRDRATSAIFDLADETPEKAVGRSLQGIGLHLLADGSQIADDIKFLRAKLSDIGEGRAAVLRAITELEALT